MHGLEEPQQKRLVIDLFAILESLQDGFPAER